MTKVGSFKLFINGAVDSIYKKAPIFKLYKTMFIYDIKNIVIDHKYVVFTGVAATVGSISYVYHGGDLFAIFSHVKTTYINYINGKYILHPVLKGPVEDTKDLVIPAIHHAARTVSQVTWAIYDGLSYEMTVRILKLKDFFMDLKSVKK